MRTLEKAAWRRVYNQIAGGDWHIVRVENWVNSGTPDVNLCRNGREIWIENKVATKTGRLKFREGQLPWIHNRCSRGGEVYVLALWEPSGYYLVKGGCALTLEAGTLGDLLHQESVLHNCIAAMGDARAIGDYLRERTNV